MAEQAAGLFLEDIAGAVGFPFEVMPTSWFQVGWSDSLAVGDVRPMKYFNQDLVMYRTEDGVVHVTSAYCPHLGAHLGYGGRVSGDRIVCPYHAWEWGPDGKNVLVPSEGCPSKTRRVLKVFDTFESNGIIWVWHDTLNREPFWDPPAERRYERKYLPVYPACTYYWEKLRAQPQFIAENSVDLDHLVFVHGNTLIPVLRDKEHMPTHEEDGHIWRNIRTPPMQNSTSIGIGISFVEFPYDPMRPHRLASMLFNCTTPIDNEHSDMFGTILVEQDMDAEGCEGAEPVGRALKRVEEQFKQAGRDIPIWHNMVYMERPAYGRLEGEAFMRVRRWCKQFYPGQDDYDALPDEPATVADVGGKVVR